MKAVQIAENIYWVGAIDWDVRNFHGYLTQRGTTYNAYLILDEKVTLIDTVKANFSHELLSRIQDIIDPAKINYIVANHAELDHSGSLPEVIKAAPGATIITSPAGERGLKAHFGGEWKYETFKTGGELKLGAMSLNFLLTPMVHWPDNMVSYMPEQKILFSNDSFGQHFACHNRFDDKCPLDIVLQEAKKYYANIGLPYSKKVQSELQSAAGMDINMIAPSHGAIWRTHIPEIMDSYTKWASNTLEKKAIIIYDTMWQSTAKMAGVVRDAFEEAHYAAIMRNLACTHISDVMTDLIEAEYICVGSPTLNTGIMPSVAGFLHYLKGLSPGSRKALAFGSYGWGGQGTTFIQKELEEMNFEVVNTHRLKYVPVAKDLDAYRQVLASVIH